MMRRILLTCAIAITACGGGESARTPSTTSADSLTNVVAAAPSGLSSAWPSALGDFIAVANTSAGSALAFRRDSLAPAPTRLTLVGFDSTTIDGVVRDVRPLPCAARAMLRMENAAGGWQLAMQPGLSTARRIEPIEDLASRDSLRLVTRLQRIANALPDSADALEFRGLPVVVRDAWLVHTANGPITVMRVARQRNLEATAHEEQRFVVLEGDQPRFVGRVAGDEETVETWDLLAALETRDALWLAVAREGVKSLQLELLVRERAEWRVGWTSDALRCAP